MGNLLKLVFGAGFNPLGVGVTALVIFAAGAGAGWVVNGWRLGVQLEHERGEVKRLNAENAILRSANQKCAVDVKATQAALAQFYAAQEALAKTVRAAMQQAAGQAAAHLQRAEELLSRPAVPEPEWCATIIREQGEAVKLRREERLKSIGR